jgi:cytoskeletal protein RodZ
MKEENEKTLLAIGKLLQAKRRELRLSLKDVGRLTNVDKTSVFRIEVGICDNFTKIKRVASLLEVDKEVWNICA